MSSGKPKTNATAVTTVARGRQVEAAACRYLQAQGLILLQQNYRLRSGEIDLIMQHDDCLVFIEVRYRKSSRFGGALHSIGLQKQQRIIRTAQHFLLHNPSPLALRFDVVAIEGSLTTQTPRIHWIQNAFDAH